ncbi:hypothetical protein CCACVL1_19850, partial [Corchorus capsularis]
INDDGAMYKPIKDLISALEEQLSMSFPEGDITSSPDVRFNPLVRDLVRLLIGFTKYTTDANPVHINRVATWLRIPYNKIPDYVETITILQRHDIFGELLVRGLIHCSAMTSLPSPTSPEIQELTLDCDSKTFTIEGDKTKILILTTKAAMRTILLSAFEVDPITGKTTHRVGLTVSQQPSHTCSHGCFICEAMSYNRRPCATVPFKIARYNAAGAGNSIHSCRSLAIKDNQAPDFMIVTETRLHGIRAIDMRSCFGYDQAQSIEPISCRGGQWVLWHSQNIHFEIFRKDELLIRGAISHVRKGPVLKDVSSSPA